MKKNKIKIFHHLDLDGYGALLMLIMALGLKLDEVNATEINYPTEDKIMDKFFESREYLEYDKIYVLDFCFNDKICETIQDLCADKVEVIDHHATNLSKNRFDFVNVEEFHKSGKRASGTSLVYEKYFKGKFSGFEVVNDFQELVRKYDTWDESMSTDDRPKCLNTVLYEAYENKYDFVNAMRERFFECLGNKLPFNDLEKFIINKTKNDIDKYCKKKIWNVVKFKHDNLNFVFSYAEQYHNELADYICEKYPETDGVLMHDPSREAFSFRARKEGTDLSKYAVALGGGGHPKACGFQTTKLKKEFLNLKLIKTCFIDA